MRIINKNGARYVLRKRAGQQYAAAFSMERNDTQVANDMFMGYAAFFPFNVKKWQFDWSKSGKPLHFKR